MKWPAAVIERLRLCPNMEILVLFLVVVLLHACFSVVGPIPFLLAAIFFSVHPYIGSTTVLPDSTVKFSGRCHYILSSVVSVYLRSVSAKDPPSYLGP